MQRKQGLLLAVLVVLSALFPNCASDDDSDSLDCATEMANTESDHGNADRVIQTVLNDDVHVVNWWYTAETPNGYQRTFVWGIGVPTCTTTEKTFTSDP